MRRCDIAEANTIQMTQELSQQKSHMSSTFQDQSSLQVSGCMNICSQKPNSWSCILQSPVSTLDATANEILGNQLCRFIYLPLSLFDTDQRVYIPWSIVLSVVGGLDDGAGAAHWCLRAGDDWNGNLDMCRGVQTPELYKNRMIILRSHNGTVVCWSDSPYTIFYATKAWYRCKYFTFLLAA